MPHPKTRTKPVAAPERAGASDRPLLPYRVAAAFLTVSLRTLKALVAQGAIPVVRVSPGRVAVDPRDLERYVESRRSAS